MIGTGIFATTGEIAASLPSHFALLAVWIGGGLLALCGALAYGELAAAMPRSGGEYHYLAKLIHPSMGFTSGFISLVAGFAAPIALSANAFGIYVSKFIPGVAEKEVALGLMCVLTLIHGINLKYGAAMQNVFTVLKVLLIILFIIAGLAYQHPEPLQLVPTNIDWGLILSAAFAVGLIQVYFAYSGWNAAAYISGEIKNPKKNVPLALVIGTSIVLILYVLLNFVFLRTVPIADMTGKIEIGHTAATVIFGATGGNFVAGLISIALISSVSSMIMAGPRVTQAIADDFPIFGYIAKRTAQGLPLPALILQLVIASIILYTGSFYDILIYIGFTLSFFALLTVAGVFVLRAKPSLAEEILDRPQFYDGIEEIGNSKEISDRPQSYDRIGKNTNTKVYKTFGYPITPALFILMNGWMIVNTVMNNSTATIAGSITLTAGIILWFVTKNLSK